MINNLKKKLVWMHENLKYNKYLYLEVPNPKIISQTKNVDEYFYDLHRFYFFEKLLSLKLIEIGFKIIKLNEINGSIFIIAIFIQFVMIRNRVCERTKNSVNCVNSSRTCRYTY